MDMERALQISNQLTKCAVVRSGVMGDRGSDPGVPDCSLLEMLEAVEMVRTAGPIDNGDGSKALPVFCDPRLVAALYVLEHYEPNSAPIVMVDGRGVGVLPVRVEVDDERISVERSSKGQVPAAEPTPWSYDPSRGWERYWPGTRNLAACVYGYWEYAVYHLGREIDSGDVAEDQDGQVRRAICDRAIAALMKGEEVERG